MLLLVGAAGGSIVCGWACPFGFLQDLLGKITPRKIALPSWTGYGRYLVLVGLVILLPMILGYKGIPFERQADFHLPPLSGGRAGSRRALLRAKRARRPRLDHERVEDRHFTFLPCGRAFHSPSLVPDALPAGRIAGALQSFQPVSSPVQSPAMRGMQPLPQPLFDGRESGSGRQRFRLHPLPGMHHLRRPRTLPSPSRKSPRNRQRPA